jgi:hypothetical protein
MTALVTKKRVYFLFLCVLFSSGVGSAFLILPNLSLGKVPGGTDLYPRVNFMPEFDKPSGDDYFFVHGRQADLSQSVLYHNLGESIKQARKADVLFIGDSRMPLGLREQVLVPKAESLGIKLFSLGMGHVEKTKFSMEIIRKFDLRPKIVVIVGGPHMFEDSYSDMSEWVVRMTRWDAIKNFYESTAWWNIQYRLHNLIPKIEIVHHRFEPGYIYYRSEKTGWWYVALEWNNRYPIEKGQERESYESYLPYARGIHQELLDRGALMIVSIVPYGRFQAGHLDLLSRELKVPVIYPRVNNLETFDGSHLSRESALRYGEAFWDTFINLPEVREKLSLPVQ